MKMNTCETCGKSFTQVSSLIRHLNLIHSIWKDDYQCMNCGYKFRRKEDIRKHMRSEHLKKTQRIHQCGTCKTVFVTKSNLQRHIGTVHSEKTKRLKCDICDRGFTRNCNLKRHKNRVHKNIYNVQCDTGSIEEHDVRTTENQISEKVDDAPSSIQNITDISIRNTQPTMDLLPPLNKCQKHNEKILQLLETRRTEREEIMKKLIQNRDDEINIFFKSIAMSIKKLTPELINEAKLRSLQMVFDLENRAASQLNLPSPASSNVPISDNSSVSDLDDYITIEMSPDSS